MNIFRVLLLATVFILVLGCGDDQEKNGLNGIIYLPYFERCESGLQTLKSIMNESSVQHSTSILMPSKNFVPGFRINALLEIRFQHSQTGQVDRIANRYMSECGPTSIIDIAVNTITDDYVRQLITGAPNVMGEYVGDYDIQMSGDTLSVFFTRPK